MRKLLERNMTNIIIRLAILRTDDFFKSELLENLFIISSLMKKMIIKLINLSFKKKVKNRGIF